MASIGSLIGRIVFNRYFLIALLVALFLLPTLASARDWCRDLPAMTNSLQEMACNYLVENRPVTNSTLLIFTQLFILIILASSWNLTGGFTGYIDFGHAVFFGIGAFTTALLMGAS
ncbi:MAG TPA: hypothetical protein VK851_06330, partial [Anaerolineales bacterium]|nr:hypothetical protein [Anaerolineales bacterium]